MRLLSAVFRVKAQHLLSLYFNNTAEKINLDFASMFLYLLIDLNANFRTNKEFFHSQEWDAECLRSEASLLSVFYFDEDARALH